MPAVEKAQAAGDPVVGLFSPDGVATFSTGSSVTLAQPDPLENDLMLAMVAVRPASASITPPSGWTEAGNWQGSAGSEGENSGSGKIYWFYKVADGTEAFSTINFTASGSPSVIGAQIMKARSATGTYAIDAQGYGVNSSVTNWNGTVSSNLPVTAGDLVVMGSVQNGNHTTTSNWDFSATGISSKSTTSKHGDFVSDLGNNIGFSLASSLMWAGSNSATPTVSLTQSDTSAGAVGALRIRQGSGTNRSDHWVRSAGAHAVGSNSVNIPYPDHDIGDLIVLFVVNRHDSGTFQTPTGWSTSGSVSVSGGNHTISENQGNARVTAVYKIATVRETGTLTATINDSNVHSVVGQMVSIHRDYVDTWSLNTVGGGHWEATTTWRVNSWSSMSISSADGGDIVMIGSAMNNDLYTYTNQAFAAGGFTFKDIQQASIMHSNIGDNTTFEVTTSKVNSGAGSASLSFTSTSSGAVPWVNPLGAGLFVKVSSTATPPSTSISLTTNGAIEFGGTSDGGTVNTVDIGSTQTVRNDGASPVDLNIRTSQATDWTLTTSVGSDAYMQFYSTDGGTNWTAFSGPNTNHSLATNVGASATQDFDLRIDVPNPSTTNNQKSITVTVQAVEP